MSTASLSSRVSGRLCLLCLVMSRLIQEHVRPDSKLAPSIEIPCSSDSLLDFECPETSRDDGNYDTRFQSMKIRRILIQRIFLVRKPFCRPAKGSLSSLRSTTLLMSCPRRPGNFCRSG